MLFLENRFLQLLLMSFILLFFNLGIEALKWKFIANKIEETTFIKAFISVLAGNSVGIFTPNKTAEFLGRMMVFKPQNRLKIALSSIVGSYSQLLTTVLFGGFASIYLLTLFPQLVPTSLLRFPWLVVFGVGAISMGMLILYFKLPYLKYLLHRFPFLRKYNDNFEFFNTFSFNQLSLILGLSCLRYLVFLLQFVLLIVAFGIPMPLHLIAGMAALWFLIITIIPSFALTEIGIRGAVSIFLFGLYFDNIGLSDNLMEKHWEMLVISASFLLWIINIVLPSVFGLFYIFKMRLIKHDVE